MRKATTLLIGVSLGVLGIALYNRLRQVAAEEDPAALIDRLSRQLESLEDRTVRTHRAPVTGV